MTYKLSQFLKFKDHYLRKRIRIYNFPKHGGQEGHKRGDKSPSKNYSIQKREILPNVCPKPENPRMNF